MKRFQLDRYAPPGINLHGEKTFFIAGMLLSTLYSVTFLSRFGRYKDDLYHRVRGENVLIPGAVMQDFDFLLDKALWGFFLLCFCLVLLAAYHYAYHRQGSKSIYLMRRLPSKLELHRRCLTLPIAGILIALLTAFLLLLIYYAVYMNVTPAECLMPGQWQKLWR